MSEKLLAGLNPAQKEAVLTTEGPVMILAGAGSGKTRTVVTRIIHLLDNLQISPYRILALTFSNKAAREMRDRVARDSNLDMGVLQITTFHSFCVRVLRSEYNYLGLGKNFTIYDESESKSVVKALMGQRGVSTKEQSPFEILNYIENFKNNGYYPGCPEREGLLVEEHDEFYSYYKDYESELHKSNALDFGGLITGVIQLFEMHPEVLERYQKRYEYLMVDEYQDTNRSQFYLMKLLSDLNRNICVVGDEDQSIYSWRGADLRNILDYEKIFPESKLIKLEQNYRSSKLIIDAASNVIANNSYRKGKVMWTDNSDGDAIRIIECKNDKVESEYIAKEIKKIISDDVSPNDIAVFYRNNAQARLIEDSLRLCNIPYRVVGGIKFYDRKEIKDLLAYIRVVINPKDSLALSRIINIPTRGIGALTIRKLETAAIEANVSLWEIIEKIVENSEEYQYLRLSGKVKSGLASFVNLIQEVKVLESSGNSLPSFSYEKLMNESGYLQALKLDKNYESLARIENLDELLSAIKQYEESCEYIKEKATLVGFMETITLDVTQAEDIERAMSKDNAEVCLMTVHSSKGLEYPYVFLAGAEDSVFPSYRSLESGTMGIEEERRLFYVAMTRAMKSLVICFAQARMLWGDLKFNGPSRFIDEIPKEFIIHNTYMGANHYGSTYNINKGVDRIVDGIDYGDEFSQAQDAFEDSSYYQISGVKESTYSQGARVRHSLYGDGTIASVEGSGNDEKVLIRFADGIQKRFMVKFAPLVLLR